MCVIQRKVSGMKALAAEGTAVASVATVRRLMSPPIDVARKRVEFEMTAASEAADHFVGSASPGSVYMIQ